MSLRFIIACVRMHAEHGSLYHSLKEWRRISSIALLSSAHCHCWPLENGGVKMCENQRPHCKTCGAYDWEATVEYTNAGWFCVNREKCQRRAYGDPYEGDRMVTWDEAMAFVDSLPPEMFE